MNRGHSVSIVVFTIILAVVYLVYTGSYGLVEITIALLVGVGVSLVLAPDLILNPSKMSPRRFITAIYYLVKYFTIIEAKAHWSVLKLILMPSAKYNPAIVRIPYSVTSDYSILLISNSITNTPGTVVIDVDEKRKYLYVHWIDATSVEDQEARKSVSEEFETMLTRYLNR